MTACFLKPGVNLIELNHVPVRYSTDVGRIDIIGDRMIVTLYDLQPGESGQREAIVTDKVGFPLRNVVDAVQFVLAAIATTGLQVTSEVAMLHS